MERHEEVFFSLLRNALWGSPVEIPGDFAEWSRVAALAKEQSLLGLIGDVMLSDSGIAPRLSGELKTKIKTFLMMNMVTHGKLNAVLMQVVGKLSDEGVGSVLLKGQGLAQYYPKPELRQCGDIDLYVGLDNYERSYDILNPIATAIDDRKVLEVGKHYHVSMGKVEVEVHRYSETYPFKKQNEKYQAIALKGLGKNLVPMMFGEMKVNTPADNYNAFFIFSHLFHHFLTSGVGLRQFCDWMLFLSMRKDWIDRDSLYEIITTMDMMLPWQAFGCVLVRVLGMPESDFPFYDASKEAKINRILSRVLEEGNFGKQRGMYKKRGKVYLFNKSLAFIGHISRTFGLVLLFPKQAFKRFALTIANGFATVWNDTKIRFGF